MTKVLKSSGSYSSIIIPSSNNSVIIRDYPARGPMEEYVVFKHNGTLKFANVSHGVTDRATGGMGVRWFAGLYELTAKSREYLESIKNQTQQWADVETDMSYIG
jgi:hypothetical protein